MPDQATVKRILSISKSAYVEMRLDESPDYSPDSMIIYTLREPYDLTEFFVYNRIVRSSIKVELRRPIFVQWDVERALIMIRAAIHELVLHEVDETISICGRRTFDPHKVSGSAEDLALAVNDVTSFGSIVSSPSLLLDSPVAFRRV